MAKERLDSDKVNYLIWRHLLESGYRETALRLQKEWNQEAPHEQLDFAPHVQDRALVTLLNKGLLYNQVERVTRPPTPDDAGLVQGIFGRLTLAQRPRMAADEDDSEFARKRQIDSELALIQNGPSKRPRLSNGYENGFDATPKSPMDVDDEQNGDNAYPSPEQLPSPVVETIGPEKGTQIDKVSELSAETSFLDLSDDPSSKNTVLLQCEFNPRDSAILAAAGTDALARMWTFSRNALEETDRSAPEYLDLLEDTLPLNTTTTGIAWSPDGNLIAIASEQANDEAARIAVMVKGGARSSMFDSFESPIICLRWNTSNNLLLALSPESNTAAVTVMSVLTEERVKYTLPNHPLGEQTLDAAWIGEDEFVLCGGDYLQAFNFSNGAITPTKKYETRDNHSLCKIVYDRSMQLLATASDSGMIDIWDQQGRSRSFNAHQGVVTSLLWQPIQESASMSESTERLLASAGEDGAISIWNALSTDAKSKSSMTMGSGVTALAFTPDGAFISGATSDRILIWKVDDVSLPRAKWSRASETGWQTPRSHDSAAEEDQHCLCWDADGQKLAYGVNGLLAVIKFQR